MVVTCPPCDMFPHVLIKLMQNLHSSYSYRKLTVIQAMSIIKKICCCCCKQTVSLEETTCPSKQLLVQSGGSVYSSGSPVHSLTVSLESYSSHCCSVTSSIGYERNHNFSKSLRKADNGASCTNSLHLECFIIPSFGKDPPDNVAVKKMAGDFLRGVEDDFEIIQQLIKDDSQKRLFEVKFMCHFAQENVAKFKRRIKSALQELKMEQKGCKYTDT